MNSHAQCPIIYAKYPPFKDIGVQGSTNATILHNMVHPKNTVFCFYSMMDQSIANYILLVQENVEPILATIAFYVGCR